VGSAKGDSQVVHVLGRDSIENNDILQVIETFPSLGPVVDFCLADLDKQVWSEKKKGGGHNQIEVFDIPSSFLFK
jgi:hypothetical protein